MTIAIKSKIVGVKVKKEGEVVDIPVAPVAVKPADIDPLLLRIERRPEGMLEAVSEKITYNTSEGRKKVYILVSFIPVEGVLDGEPIMIERPIEFFFPMGQLSSEHQWITATMRNLSLAARGGYVTQALADLRKVAWDKGPVRCGTNQWGKPIFHDSEVAAIAWSIQQILQKRGFVDVDGNQVPTHALSRGYARRFAPVTVAADEDRDAAAVIAAESTPFEPVPHSSTVGICPECQSDLVLLDGCATCTSCGHSKCS